MTLIAELEAIGVRVVENDGELKLTGATEKITPEMLAACKEQRAELLQQIQEDAWNEEVDAALKEIEKRVGPHLGGKTHMSDKWPTD